MKTHTILIIIILFSIIVYQNFIQDKVYTNDSVQWIISKLHDDCNERLNRTVSEVSFQTASQVYGWMIEQIERDYNVTLWEDFVYEIDIAIDLSFLE